MLPDVVFTDRSLGRHKVPSLLRKAGLTVVTLAQYYGIPTDENVRDTDWLCLVGRKRWIVFMKDSAIRRRKEERETLMQHQVRAFCLNSATLPADEMARRFISNLPAIARACLQPGPFLYVVEACRIRRLLP